MTVTAMDTDTAAKKVIAPARDIEVSKTIKNDAFIENRAAIAEANFIALSVDGQAHVLSAIVEALRSTYGAYSRAESASASKRDLYDERVRPRVSQMYVLECPTLAAKLLNSLPSAPRATLRLEGDIGRGLPRATGGPCAYRRRARKSL